MANFIIKPKDDDHLKLQNDAGNDIVEIKNDDKVLYVSRDSVNAEVALESYHSTDGTTPKLTMRKADGSGASPTVVANNDVLGTISFQGNDGGAGAWEEGARIEARVDGTPGANDMPTELTFWTTPDGTNAAVERVVIDDAGNVTVKRDSANTEVALESYHDTEATTPKLAMKKSDGSIASPALVDNEAVLGTISFQGHDGTNFEEGARIEARVDGTAASNDMPGELTFWTTPDGSATAVQRMTINPAGNIVISTAGAGVTFSSTNTPAQSSGTGSHNTLDDYEEGTWTATGSANLTTTGGYYTKIGRLVYCTALLGTDSGGSAGQTLGGLPFTSNSANSSRGGGTAGYQGFSSGNTPSVMVNDNATTFGMHVANADAPLLASNICFVSFTYITA